MNRNMFLLFIIPVSFLLFNFAVLANNIANLNINADLPSLVIKNNDFVFALPRSKSLCTKSPVVSAWSNPVSAGESLFVAGSYFSSKSLILIQALNKNISIQIKVNNANQSFLISTLPDQLSNTPFLAVVGNNDCWSNPILLNAPEPWWIYSPNLHAGDQLRLFGNNFIKDQNLRIYIEAENKVGRWLKPDDQTNYWIKSTLPVDLTPGIYKLWLYTGGGSFGWSKSLTFSVLQTLNTTKIIEVKTSQELLKALNTLSTEGGIIQLLEGKYILNEALEIPTKVQIHGAGINKSIIIFTKSLKNTLGLVKAPDPKFSQLDTLVEPIPGKQGVQATAGILIFKSDTVVSDLTIQGSGFVEQAIAIAGTRLSPVKRVKIYNVKVEDLAQFRVPHGQTEAVMARHVDGLEIKNSFILGTGPAFFLEDISNSSFIDNSLAGGGEGIITAREGGIKHCIIEHNHLLSVQNGAVQAIRALWLSSLFGSTYENYIANNYGENFYPPPGTEQNRGEAILFETSLSHPYLGHPISATSNSISLPQDGPDWSMLSSQPEMRTTFLDNYFVVILNGKGQGQARRIVARHGDKLNIERPWLVVPNEDSTILLTELFYRNLVIGNEIHRAKKGGIWFWINGIENVIANNQLSDFTAQGILVIGAASGGSQFKQPIWPILGHDRPGFNRGIGPSFFNEVVNNYVSNSQDGIYISASDYRLRKDSILWPLSMGNVVRQNQVANISKFGIWTGICGWSAPQIQASGFSLVGNLVEKNNVSNAEAPYGSDERSSMIVLRHNIGKLALHIKNNTQQLIKKPDSVLDWLIEDNQLESEYNFNMNSKEKAVESRELFPLRCQ